MAKTFKVGEKWMIVDFPEAGPQPVLAEIVVLTNEPGRLVGVKLPYKTTHSHSLGGRVEKGYGLWVHPQYMMTEQEYKTKCVIEAQAAPYLAPLEMTEMTFDDATGEIVKHTVAEKQQPAPVEPPDKPFVPEAVKKVEPAKKA